MLTLAEYTYLHCLLLAVLRSHISAPNSAVKCNELTQSVTSDELTLSVTSDELTLFVTCVAGVLSVLAIA